MCLNDLSKIHLSDFKMEVKMVPHHCKFNSSLFSKREFNKEIKKSFWTLWDVFIFCETITGKSRTDNTACFKRHVRDQKIIISLHN